MSLSQNPYIAGNPVGGGPAFIGRTDILREVIRLLENPNANAIVLYGQRRMGKTSILQELTEHLPKKGAYHPVLFDLQDKAALPLPQVLEALARDINYSLSSPEIEIDFSQGDSFHTKFLPQVLTILPPNCSLVLLFDEFDVLDSPTANQAGSAFFPYLRQLMEIDRQRLKFVMVIGRKPEDLTNLALSVFKGVKSIRISLLDRKDASRLVCLSQVNETLNWTQEAVDSVWALTNGHPYLTQQLCEIVWNEAYDNASEIPPTITPVQVLSAIPETINSSVNALEWVWNGLAPPERIVASVLAEAGSRPIDQAELEQRLTESGVRVVISQLQNAPGILQEWDLIEPIEGGYRFRVELLRRWIAEKKSINRVQQELDQIEPVANDLYRAGQGLYQNGQLNKAVDLLHQALGLNPNHLQAGLLLAQILLARRELTEAVTLLETIYEYNPGAARPRLVQALLDQAKQAEKADDKLNLYERILTLTPTQIEALEGRKVILQSKAKDFEAQKQYNEALATIEKLAFEFPTESAFWEPTQNRLRIKLKLAQAYRKGLGALQEDDQKEAQKLLTEIVALDLGYEDALEHLLKALKGVDVFELQSRLAGEEKDKKRVERAVAAISKENKVKDSRIARLQSQLTEETSLRKKAEHNIIVRPFQASLMITYLVIGITVWSLINFHFVTVSNFMGFLIIVALIVIPAVIFVGLSWIKDVLAKRRQPAPPPILSKEEGSPPLKRWIGTYTLGQDNYDEFFTIETEKGIFIGESGMGIMNTISGTVPKQVTALDVGVFDKTDISTLSRVVMTRHAYNDQNLRAMIDSNPQAEAILAKPGKEFIMETGALRVKAKIEEMEYGQGGSVYFNKLRLSLTVFLKEGVDLTIGTIDVPKQSS